MCLKTGCRLCMCHALISHFYFLNFQRLVYLSTKKINQSIFHEPFQVLPSPLGFSLDIPAAHSSGITGVMLRYFETLSKRHHGNKLVQPRACLIAACVFVYNILHELNKRRFIVCPVTCDAWMLRRNPLIPLSFIKRTF